MPNIAVSMGMEAAESTFVGFAGNPAGRVVGPAARAGSEEHQSEHVADSEEHQDDDGDYERHQSHHRQQLSAGFSIHLRR